MWDGKLYIEEAYKQLDNPTSYQKLKPTTLSVHQREISKTEREHILTDALPMTAKLLIKHYPKLPAFYLLPKINKFNNRGRPIVSACSCPTEHISEYLDTVLQALVCFGSFFFFNLDSSVTDKCWLARHFTGLFLLHFLISSDTQAYQTVAFIQKDTPSSCVCVYVCVYSCVCVCVCVCLCACVCVERRFDASFFIFIF